MEAWRTEDKISAEAKGSKSIELRYIENPEKGKHKRPKPMTSTHKSFPILKQKRCLPA